MYYELYIDVLFGVNMIMDFFLLSLTGRLLGSHAAFWRICLGSVAGAAAVCAVIWLRLPDTVWRSVLLYGGVNSLMILISFGGRRRTDFIRSFICLYIGGFLLGGIYQWLSVNIRNFLMLSTMSYIILTLVMHLYKRLRIHKQSIYNVTLCINGKTKAVRALNDTGNSLRDPLSGRPVSILEAGVVNELLSEQEQQMLSSMSHFQAMAETSAAAGTGLKMHFIPYRSVGKKDGMMPGIFLEKMYVGGTDGYVIENPVIAVCQEPLASDEHYQMILHPELVEDHTLIL